MSHTDKPYKLAVTSAYIDEKHIRPYLGDEYYRTEVVQTTDGKLFARFPCSFALENGLRVTEYVYIPTTELSEFIDRLQEINPLHADAVMDAPVPEDPDPEAVPENVPYLPFDIDDTGGQYCGPGCTCYPEPEEEYEAVPWDYDAHTPFENELHDRFVEGLLAAIARTPSVLLFSVIGR